MKLIVLTLLAFYQALAFIPHSFAQCPERWERLGPVTFTSIVEQSPSVLSMTTADGWLYVSSDYGVTWNHRYIDDTLSLVDAKYADSLHGVLISSDGTVLFTSDGGAAWTRSHVPGGALVHVAYPSANIAYVCSHGGIWETRDRGASWTLHLVSPTKTINALYFFDDNNGTVIGTSGLYARTTDGGQQWSMKDIGAGDSLELTCMDFFRSDTGIVASAGYTFATTNQGDTWHRSPLLPTFYNRPTAIKLTSGHQFFGFIDGIDEFSSADLGSSFSPLQQIFGSGEVAINGACAVPGHGVIIAGGDGEIEQSIDAGRSWSTLNLCVSKENLISVGDSMLCGIGGYGGNTFYSSTDRGASWSTYAFYHEFWRTVWFKTPQAGIAVNQSGNLSASTTDGGRSWFNDVEWSDKGIPEIPHVGLGEFVGHGDTAYFLANDSIYATTDFGETWAVTKIAEPDTSSPYPGIPASTIYKPGASYIDFLDRTHWYIEFTCTDGPGSWDLHYHQRYYETSDAGESWQMIKSAPFEGMGMIYFRTPSVGFICGIHGNIFRTSNGGVTWQSQVLTGDHGISAISFLNDSVGFCAANDASPGQGQIFETTNGGLTWQDDSLRIPKDVKRPWITGIIFPDSNTILVLSHEGFFRRTLGFSSFSSVVEADGFKAAKGLLAYPNPATKWLHLVHVTGDPRVFDVLGRSVNCRWIASEGLLYVGDLEPGLYYAIDVAGRRIKFERR
jgi:photosystem II stability/assembly factor-like uncharacterized protein